MRIKQLLNIFPLVVIIFLTSCVSSNPAAKQFIGTWKAHKAAPYIISGQETPPIPGMKVTDSTQAGKQQVNLFSDDKRLGKLHRIIDAQQKTTIKLNANKTGEILFPEKTLQMTWKLKKDGKTLIVKELESGQKRTLDFVFINDTASMAILNTEVGDIIIKYRKQ